MRRRVGHSLATDSSPSKSHGRFCRTSPRDSKVALLDAHRPPNYRGDVWLLTEKDAHTRIDGSRNDLFVLRLQEHSGGGYLWDIDQLKASGFGVVRDERDALDDASIGGPATRRVTAEPPEITVVG